MGTFSTVPEGYDFRDTDCRGSYFICWPTVAPSSLDYYDGGGVPGWGPSLLMPSLKDGAVYRIPLGADDGVAGEPEQLWRTVNRYRDVAIAPDGRTFYVVTDPFGLSPRPGWAADRQPRSTPARSWSSATPAHLA